MSKCLSKMNKKELYELSKKLVEENKTLQLFINGDEEKVEFLENKILDLEKSVKELEDTLILKEEEVSMLIYEKRQENNKVCNLLSKIHHYHLTDFKKLVEENEKLKEQVLKEQFISTKYIDKIQDLEKKLKESDNSNSSDEE